MLTTLSQTPISSTNVYPSPKKGKRKKDITGCKDTLQNLQPTEQMVSDYVHKESSFMLKQ